MSPSRLQYAGPTTSVAQGAALASQPSTETLTVSNGCFWGTEHMYTHTFQDKLKSVSVGYIGGDENDPHYRMVCSGKTGYAESFKMTFDPSVVSYAELVEFNFRMHDPTTLNFQGPDRGPQYRSAIWYYSPEQKATAEAIRDELQKTRFESKPIVTEINNAADHKWYDAEQYHQKYLDLNPSGYECPTHRLHF